MATKRNTILALLIVAGSLTGQPLAQGERDMAMSHLHASRKLVLDSIEGLSPSQWVFKPAPESWSIAECIENLAIYEDSLYEEVTGKIIKTQPISEKEANKQTKNDSQVLETLYEQDRKLQAIDSQQPTGKWASKEALVGHFKESRDRAIAYIEKTPDELRRHLAPHDLLGSLDAYQCFLALSVHTERYVAQIQEVKVHPDYPRK